MRAGFYECDITPPLGGFMWGHYNERLAENVLDRLYAKAFVVEDKGEYAAVVVVDTCSLVDGIFEKVTERIAQYTDIPADRVCITSNHTHYGASVGRSPEVNCFPDETYLDVFLRLTADAVILAYLRLEEMEISFAQGSVDSISFIRNFVTTDGTFITHGRGRDDIAGTLGEIDPALPVLLFKKDGKPKGAVISFACHQDCVYEHKTWYTGDYSSALSDCLKDEFGRDFVSVFLLGTCGDINHVNPNGPKTEPGHYRVMGKTLADEVLRILPEAKPVEGGVKMITEDVTLRRRTLEKGEMKQAVLDLLQNEGGTIMRARNLIFYGSSNKLSESDYKVQGILIGDVFISTLPDEVYSAFGHDIKKGSPFSRNMVIENCNVYCGYIPTANAFAPNSRLYETSTCFHSCHVPEAGEIIRDKALEIARKLAE